MGKFTKKEKRNIQIGLILIFGILVAAEMGYIPQIGQPSQWLAPQAEYVVDEGTEVYVKITTRLMLGLGTTDLVVNMYDEAGNFIDTVTTSSGVGTFSGMYAVGREVQLQGRQAAPASADPYITPLTAFIVSNAGESADTVVLKNKATKDSILWFKDVSGSAPTMVIRNGFDNNTISDTTQQLNTTDDAFKASLTVASSNCYYGADSFTDMITGRSYAGGVFLYWKGTVTQQWENVPTYTWSDPTNTHYVWKIADAIWYDANGDISSRTVTAVISITAGNTFADDTSVTIDMFDMIDLSQMGSSGCLIDGGSTGVTAISTDIS